MSVRFIEFLLYDVLQESLSSLYSQYPLRVKQQESKLARYVYTVYRDSTVRCFAGVAVVSVQPVPALGDTTGEQVS